MYVWAINGKGQKRRFTKRSWELMGANKEGWRETINEAVEIPVKITQKPNTGEVKLNVNQVIDEVGKDKKPDEQTVTAVKTSDATAATQTITDEAEALKQAFFDEIKTLTKGPIKDFFDHKGVKYNNAAKLDDLKAQLGEYFNHNVFEYQKNFKIR